MTIAAFCVRRFAIFTSMSKDTPPPKVVRAHPDEDSWLLFGSDIGGAFTMGRSTLAPGDGTPPHVHTREDETYYVLSGEIEVAIADERGTLRDGDCVFLPRGVPHGLKNSGSNDAEVLMRIHPPGFEKFLDEMAELRNRGASSEEMAELVARSI